MSVRADSFFQRLWYDRAVPWLSLLLLPLAWLFGALVGARRLLFRVGVLRVHRVARPVIVVGNITVGGTGKTPFTIWLAERLRARGLRVGIVLRGYGGRSTRSPQRVHRDSDWQEVGDEAVLLARRTSAIVVACADRVSAARRAIEAGAQVVLSDDGLQHYRLGRDCEIAVIDARRGLGNGRLLPAGPLREPRGRLARVDLTVCTRREAPVPAPTATRRTPAPPETGPSRGAATGSGAIHATPKLLDAVAVLDGERRSLESFRGMRVHAVAGIGHPQAFFDALVSMGLQVHGRALPDHARLTPADIAFPDDAPVLMTEKDAVKCRPFADRRHWAVRMELEVTSEDAAAVTALLDRVLAEAET